jgi:hypothetical protein
MGTLSRSEVWAVRSLIASLPEEAQCHIETVAAALRQIVTGDEGQETELAVTLVLAEIMGRTTCGTRRGATYQAGR